MWFRVDAEMHLPCPIDTEMVRLKMQAEHAAAGLLAIRVEPEEKERDVQSEL